MTGMSCIDTKKTKTEKDIRLKMENTLTAVAATTTDLHDRDLLAIIEREIGFQNTTLNLTAASNYLSPFIGSAMNLALNNIHCEGYPGKRFHEGQQYADAIENLAIERAKTLFKADHANVEPYRGTMANVAACIATSKPGDTILGFECGAGGHFTTGGTVHLTSRMFNIETYGVDADTQELNYQSIQGRAHAVRPSAIFVGDTAYSGLWDWPILREIADSVDAALVADVSQTAGLIASGVIASPVPFVDIVTMATYKTLRGPRAGLIVCKSDYKSRVDRAVFPVCQDGTSIMQIAGIAAALFEAAQPAFREYCQQVLDNASRLAEGLSESGYKIVSGKTHNHACMIDLSETEMTGRQAAAALARANIICNANQIPFDQGPPTNPSGLVVGTAAVTTLGMGCADMAVISDMVASGLRAFGQGQKLDALGLDVLDFRSQFDDNEFLKTPYANPAIVDSNTVAVPNPQWDERAGCASSARR